MKNKVIVGSRESRLAVIQSEMVMDFIKKACPGMEVELFTMKTTGDIILDRTLDKIGGKGLFVKELDKALLDGRSDLSVHSLKDMPMEVSKELPIVAFSKREDPRDVLVLPSGAERIDFSKPIGCSSSRRILQLKELFPEADFKSVRGNVLTRLRKLDDGEYGALILAAAGLKRLGLEERISRYFTPDEIIPAAGQGILAVQGRRGEDYGFLEGFGDEEAKYAALCERAFVRTLNGGCSSPVAAHGVVEGEKLTLRGLYYDEESGGYRKGIVQGPLSEAEKIGVFLAERLREDYRKGLKEKAPVKAQGSFDAQETSQGEKSGCLEPFGQIKGQEEETAASKEKGTTETVPGLGLEKELSDARPEKEQGKVWLVGAGPGDIGLFTLKGAKVLSEAEVVVYDALVGQSILNRIPRSAKLINVGKRSSSHTMKQEDINQVLVEEARKGKRVVRLKGGDPFLFGRGGEELELLVENHIPYEVVPGVTSALSVPAYNGIPVTHRDFCSSLHIITGHKRQGESYDIDFEALVRTKGTLVFLMGVGALKDICKGLLDGGMSPDMPAAILQKGTTARQKRIVATVSTLPIEVERQGIETPAIIVVGKVCSLSEEFGWFEKLPLFGKKILVTRPKELSSRMSEKLRRKGAEVLELPAIVTKAIRPNERLRDAIACLRSYQWIVFTSPTGVRVFFEALREADKDVRNLFGAKLAVIGTGTAKELKERGLYPDLMPETFDGESLGKAMAAVCRPGERVMIPRAALGGPELIRELEAVEGLVIEEIPTYDTAYESQELIDEKAEFENGGIDYAVFTSASTVRGFAKAADGVDFKKVKAVCIGKQTKAAADALGMITFMSREAAMDSVVDCVEELIRKEKGGREDGADQKTEKA